MHPLDNAVWNALTTHQSSLALVEGMARRFPPEMAMFGALALPLPPAWEALSRLAKAPVSMYSVAPLEPPPGWSVTRHIELVQMVAPDDLPMEDAPVAASSAASPEVIELRETDMEGMSALYTATRPGRAICPRLLKLGTFLGIRCDGRLVAMGGVRMHLPGYREITAVATMPGYEGRGYATALVAALADRIRRHKERPYLSTGVNNARAIAIYRRLGFHERTRLHSTTLAFSPG